MLIYSFFLISDYVLQHCKKTWVVISFLSALQLVEFVAKPVSGFTVQATASSVLELTDLPKDI